MPRRNQPEFRIQCAVADQLRFRALPGLFWTALANGENRPKVMDAQGRWYSPTGERLQRSGLRPGNPDLLLIWQGRAIGLELKAEGGRQNANQRATQTDWTLAGGLYHVAKGFQEAMAFLEMLGVLRPDRSLTRSQPSEEARA